MKIDREPSPEAPVGAAGNAGCSGAHSGETCDDDEAKVDKLCLYVFIMISRNSYYGLTKRFRNSLHKIRLVFELKKAISWSYPTPEGLVQRLQLEGPAEECDANGRTQGTPQLHGHERQGKDRSVASSESILCERRAQYQGPSYLVEISIHQRRMDCCVHKGRSFAIEPYL